VTTYYDNSDYDNPPGTSRQRTRFLAFGIAVVVGVAGLGGRLFYLEIANGAALPPLAPIFSAAVQAVPSSRGLIYDRAGRPLVANVPVYVVKIRPADLPLPRRPEVVTRLAALIGTPEADINAELDASTGSRFDLVRIAGPVPRATADLILESATDLPGVEIVVEARREYPAGPLLSQVVGYTAPITARQLERGAAVSYLPDDSIGVAGVEATYESQLRGEYGVQRIERDQAGRNVQVLATTQPTAGASLRLTIDSREQQLAQQALQWGMRAAGLKRGVVIVMNPQTGELLALVTLPTYDDNAFATGISGVAFRGLVNNPDKPLTNHAIQGQYAPGSTYKLVAGTGALADRKITASTRLTTRAYLTLGRSKFYDWNRRGFGACDLRCGFGHSSDTFFFQLAGMLGIDRLGYWAKQFGFGQATGIDLPGEVAGIVPTNQWKLETRGLPIYPGEVYQAGIGQGYDAVTPIQLITAYAALANGGRVMQPQVVREVVAADGTVTRPFEPHVVRQVGAPQGVLREMREAARNVVLVRHTYNLVDLPIIVAGKSGTAEFGIRDRKGRLPFHSWFVGFVPANPRIQPGDPRGLKAVARTDSDLIVLAFAYDSRTKGNTATEIAKYFLQLHFGIKKDYRIPNLLDRGNFYEGN
jgi:penicillin-binding protein 2